MAAEDGVVADGQYLSRERRLLAGHIAVLSVVVAVLTAWHPYPLVHPDPKEFQRVGLLMVESGDLLVTWDPPLRYAPIYLLYLLTDPGPGLAGRLAVLQAAVVSYLVVPLSVYGYVAAVRSRRAGLVAVTAAVLATAAGLPPTAVVWHHWQVDVAVPVALAAMATAHRTLVARGDGQRRRELGYAALTAVLCGLTLNVEPWVALFVSAGIGAAWAAHLAVGPLALATALGGLASLPVLAVPRWEVHLSLFVYEVIDPTGPLLAADPVVSALSSPGTYGVLALLGGSYLLARRGASLPGGAVTGFAVLAGAWVWALFRVTTLSGIGTRGLIWCLQVAVPAVAVQATEALPAEGLAAETHRRLFERPRLAEWIALYGAELALLIVSVGLFVLTFEPPERPT